jgi:hypothetical protein
MTSQHRKRRYCCFVSAISLLLLCIISCGIMALTIVIVLDTYAEAEPFEYTIETKVAVDASFLPEHPTEADWYLIAKQSLEDSGWELSPNLTKIWTTFPCQSDGVLDHLEMQFSDAYFSGIIPHLKVASVSLNHTRDVASVRIGDEASRWRHSPMDVSAMKVGFYEAVKIADRYAGKEFRQTVNDRCEMTVFVTDYTWKVYYFRDDQQIPVPDLKIEINARSGKVKRLSR